MTVNAQTMLELAELLKAVDRTLAFLAATPSQEVPAQPQREEMVPKHLLDGRDNFIVSKGLWSEFVDSLPRPESETP